MTRQEWKDSEYVIFIKNKLNGFLLGFFNPSDDLLAVKKLEDIPQMVTNLNKNNNFLTFELIKGKARVGSDNPGI